ncbi:radical SAM protein [Candidatus Bathyarchaeota archaeon]|nr:radical SAM protein [Candidatus Bathyarchaeota archaeon]
MSNNIHDILQSTLKGNEISRKECLELMDIHEFSPEMYELFYTANKLTRERSNNTGQIHAQIGLDYTACPRKCGFCIFGGIPNEKIELSKEEILTRAKKFERAGADALYLMTTASFDFSNFINLGKEVKKSLSTKIPLVANIDDFGSTEAQELRDVGFTAIYHAVRLREGKDTKIDPKTRISTIENAKRAGLKIYFCVEPIGPEHNADEIIDLIFLGKTLGVEFSGAMRRTPTPTTRLYDKGEINLVQLAKIVAITRIVMLNSVIWNCTHEPNLPSLLAGANIIWAETGPNPRDKCHDTSSSEGKGLSVEQCRNLLMEAGLKESPKNYAP